MRISEFIVKTYTCVCCEEKHEFIMHHTVQRISNIGRALCVYTHLINVEKKNTIVFWHFFPLYCTWNETIILIYFLKATLCPNMVRTHGMYNSSTINTHIHWICANRCLHLYVPIFLMKIMTAIDKVCTKVCQISPKASKTTSDGSLDLNNFNKLSRAHTEKTICVCMRKKRRSIIRIWIKSLILLWVYMLHTNWIV